MDHSILDYFKEIEQRRLEIAKHKQTIDEKTLEYEQAIATPKSLIEKNRLEIENIKKSGVKAELKDILDEIAREWNTTADQLNVNFQTYFVHSNVNLQYENAGVKDISGYDLLNVVISYKNNNHPLHYTSFSLPLKYDEPQKDGKPLSEHLAYIRPSKVAGQLMTPSKNQKNIVFDDLNSLIVNFEVGEFFDIKGNIKDDFKTKAILNACELYSKKTFQPFNVK